MEATVRCRKLHFRRSPANVWSGKQLGSFDLARPTLCCGHFGLSAACPASPRPCSCSTLVGLRVSGRVERSFSLFSRQPHCRFCGARSVIASSQHLQGCVSCSCSCILTVRTISQRLYSQFKRHADTDTDPLSTQGAFRTWFHAALPLSRFPRIETYAAS